MPSAEITIAALKRLLAHEPPDEHAYVVRTLPNHRPWAWPERLELLVASEQRPRLLLHGPIGVGKTTELRRWMQALGPGRARLVTLAQGTGPMDAMRALAIGLAKQIELEGRGATGHEAKALGALSPHEPRWWAVLADVLGRWPVAPVVLVDGLDLVATEQVRDFFGPGSLFAAPELPPMVISAPHALIVAEPVGDRHSAFGVAHVSPFPVSSPNDAADRVVVAWLVEGLRRRLPSDLQISTGILANAAWFGGGVLRDTVRILRGTLLAAVNAPTVGPAHLLEGLREVRQDLTQSLTNDELVRLSSVHSESTLGDFASLIRKNAVLVFEGDERRYPQLHPLLREEQSLLMDWE